MKTSKSSNLYVALQEEKKTNPFYQLPTDWPGVVLVKSDEESTSTTWWRRTIFRAILRKRSPTELSHAISWLEKVMPSVSDLSTGTNRFRPLLKLTDKVSHQIQGFPDAADIELYALLAVLLINERKQAVKVVERTHKSDHPWFTENEAQIEEVSIVCWKLREAYLAGEENGRVSNNKKGGTARHKKVSPYREPVVTQYETGQKQGKWNNLGEATKQIHDDIKAKKVPNEPIPSLLTIERWIRDHRQGKGFDLDGEMSVVYL